MPEDSAEWIRSREKASLLIALLAAGRSHYHGPGLFHTREFLILAGRINEKSPMHSLKQKGTLKLACIELSRMLSSARCIQTLLTAPKSGCVK